MVPEGPVVLSAETSGDVCGVAVSRGEQLSAEITFRHGMHLSERLIGHVQSVLRESGLDLKDVELYAAGVGPGSFTGARIGVTTIKVLAAIQQRPVMAVSSLDAIAWHYMGLTGRIVIPILPCRTGVVYAGLFDVSSQLPEPIGAPDAIAVTDLASLISTLEAPVVICGPALDRYADRLDIVNVSLGMRSWPRAGSVAAVAARRLTLGGEGQDPVALTPLYMSPPPITMPKDRRGLVAAGPAIVPPGHSAT